MSALPKYFLLKFSYLFCFFISSIFAAPSQTEEIRIYLATQTHLQPLYFGKIQCPDHSLPPTYLNQIEGIFHFDFNHNGTTSVVPPHAQKEQLLADPNLSVALNPNTWQQLGMSYVIKVLIEKKILSAHVLTAQTGSVKQFSQIELTGNLSKDRRRIHQLVDSIHKSLFSEEGICSTQILFSKKSKENLSQNKRQWSAEIWVCDWDGSNARQLTKEGSYCVHPVFFPSSRTFANDRFLYVSYKMGQPKIFVASMKEGSGKRLIDLKGNQLLPAISRGRDKIAFISDASGRTDLFLQEFNPDTGQARKPVQLFSYPNSTQASPTFNPDGSKIAFVSDKDGSPRIYTLPAHFSSKRAMPTLITKANRENSCPSWSPDGKKLAYSAKTKDVRQIWIYDFEKGEERQLTDGPGNKENPSWAPNSKHLVFNSTGSDTSELYIVNLDQGKAIKISEGPGIKHYPTWGNRYKDI